MELRFVVLPGRADSSPLPNDYLSAYKTFHDVWEETLRPIRGAAYVQYSNDFTRQDRIQALFDGDACAGLDCVRRINLQTLVDLNDSWLEPWPSDLLNTLSEQSPAAFINSYFTVGPQYRRTAIKGEHPVSYVLGCLSVLYQAAADVPLMLGMMRHDRSMHKLGAMWGAKTLLTTTYNQSETDLVVFEIDAVKSAARVFPQFVLELFERRSDCR
jgi:hypothetical protein